MRSQEEIIQFDENIIAEYEVHSKPHLRCICEFLGITADECIEGLMHLAACGIQIGGESL